MSALKNKRVLIGLSGGVAAYKGAELVRLVRKAGADVRVVMTDNATRFISPLSLQALSARPVHTALLDPATESAMGHIELARWADIVVIAPASANCIARLSAGLADDLLSAVCLASDCMLYIAPAMNQQMWNNPATRHNVGLLRERGVRVLEPEVGDQACGEYGPGCMPEPNAIVAVLEGHFRNGLLQGIAVMITAGPTREPIDPVRHISNRSSGRMGYAIAEAAFEMGADVFLVSGPVALPPPEGARLTRVQTAGEMFTQVMQTIQGMDIFIAAAAVTDYSCADISPQKIKKNHPTMELKLRRTADILSAVAHRDPSPFTVGFAAETERIEDYARGKLRDKALNMIVANQVGEAQGIGTEDNSLVLLWDGGRLCLPRMPKTRLARRLLQTVVQRYHVQFPYAAQSRH